MKLPVSPLAPERFPDLPEVGGVRAATASRGLYARRGIVRDDVFLFAFPGGTTTAGVFTVSHTQSDDVKWCRSALAAGGGSARALLVNAGNSNAFTGPFGRRKNAASVAALMATFDAPEAACFLAATGVIGEPLPSAEYIAELVPDMAARLAAPDWLACARAFMTTDTFPKGAGHVAEIGGARVAFAGIAKGSGMIAPNMATMLAYVFTDAAVSADVLQAALAGVTDETFNCITVDSDTSTSDTLMVFATGGSGMEPINGTDDVRYPAFRAALCATCLDLAHQIVRDGEGAGKFVTVRVEGAVSDASARVMAASIANSPLIKTAMAAGDANWGRVVMAVGKAREPINADALQIWFDDVAVARDGARAPDYDEAAASGVFAQREFTIRVDVGAGGSGRATVWTCDLTHGYVDINGAYRT